MQYLTASKILTSVTSCVAVRLTINKPVETLSQTGTFPVSLAYSEIAEFLLQQAVHLFDIL